MTPLQKAQSVLKTARLPLLWLVVGSQVVIIAAIFSAATYLLAKEQGASAGEISKDSFFTQKIATLEQHLLSILPLSFSKKEAPLVAVIIENHEDARPQQAGLQEAEVVFEMIAEGDISRFLALFRGNDLPDFIGPVRSLRLHFVSVLDAYKTPLLLHIGGNPLAYDALRRDSNIIDHDGIRYDGQTYERALGIPAPHNLFISKDAVLSVLEEHELKITETAFPLYPMGKAPAGNAEEAEMISVNFGSSIHDVTYTYDSWQDEYKRKIEGAAEQGSPENVLVLEVAIQGYGERGAIPWTNTYGSGKMLLFRNGKKFEGTWKREEGKPFSFWTKEGQPLLLESGQAWMMFLPRLSAITWAS